MNILYLGEHGRGKRALALKEADRILGEPHENSADFMLVEPEDGLISIDRFPEIKEFCRYEGRNRVVVIIGMDKCVEKKFQQAMLKLLEDTEITFLITAERNLLDTIHSRCSVVRVDGGEGIEEGEGDALRLSLGNRGLYEELSKDEAFCKIGVDIISNLYDKRKVFTLLGIIPENDTKGSGFDRYGDVKMKALLDAVIEQLIEDGNYGAAEYASGEKERVVRQFSKNLWFVYWKNVYERVEEDKKNGTV